MAPVHHNSDRTSAGVSTGAQAPQAAGAQPVSPRTVIRGESHLSRIRTQGKGANPLAALVDYLNCTFPTRGGKDVPRDFLERLAGATGDAFGTMQERLERGLHGWTRSFAFERGKVLYAIGGQRNTAYLSIPGEGCSLVPDWIRLASFLRDDLRGHLTRLDLAHDDFDGIHNIEDMVERHRRGEFKTGGRQPKAREAGDWLFPDGSGRTFYIGHRRNGKLYRGYEKGKKEGCPNSCWMRHEVELHNLDREIPWEAVLAPGRYLAGAYPALSWVSEDASRIRTLKRADQIGYDRLVRSAKASYGPLVNVMRDREGSDEAVVSMLIRPGAPKRLALTQRLRVHKEPDA